MTLKFDGWHWKIIGHLFYTTLSFVQHFKATGRFKLELQSGKAQVGSKLAIVLFRVTLNIDVWPWKTIGYLFYTTSSFVHPYRNWPRYGLRWSGWYCNREQHELCRSSRGRLRPAQRVAAPDCSTSHDSADRISGQFLFYHDHNLQKVRETCVFDVLYRCLSPSAFA